MNQSDWSIRLLDPEFEQRREEYGSPSLFVLIYSEEGVDYDREVLGEALLPDDEWGCIDPPGPSGGFGEILTSDLLEGSGGRLALGALREISSADDIANEIFPYLDGVFMANEQEQVFEELEHDVNVLADLLSAGSDGDCIEIVEYEPD